MGCKCNQCGVVFPVEQSRVGRTKYCSKKCKDEARENKQQWTCAYPPCGRMFSVKASQQRKYCSLECFYDDIMIPIKPLPFGELERTEIEAKILQYTGLVHKIARRLYNLLSPRMLELDDFIQVGMLGLIDAIQRDDDPTLTDHFPGFASDHIRYEIFYAFRTQEHTIRLPESLFRKDEHATKTTPEQMEQYRKISNCTSLDAYPDDLAAATRKLRHHAPLRPLDERSPIEQDIIKQERLDDLYQSLQKLPPQQLDLINQHYGLTCDATAMLQLCYRYKIARVTMHRLVHRGLDVLKSELSE
jgi:RNA polymerase sigma factor (sigma-70 family)